jgi:peptide subunit release factor 1 (eRF1)
MTNTANKLVGFQCPQCGCALELTIGQIKSPEPMRCSGCGVGISTDANGASDVAAEIREAAEKVPAEITIKFVDRPENEDDGA